MRRRSTRAFLRLAVLMVWALVAMAVIPSGYAAATSDEALFVPLVGVDAGVGQNQNPSERLANISDEEFREKFARVWGEEAATNVHRYKTPGGFDETQTGLGEVSWATQLTAQNEAWAGYESRVSGINGVIARITARHCTGTNAYDGSWVGLLNSGRTELLQTGVDQYLMALRYPPHAVPAG
jgi:hypothetical protein